MEVLISLSAVCSAAVHTLENSQNVELQWDWPINFKEKSYRSDRIVVQPFGLVDLSVYLSVCLSSCLSFYQAFQTDREMPKVDC